MEENKFINGEAKKLARELHKEEHLIIDKKIDNDHKLYDWYYLMASGIFVQLKEILEKGVNLDFLYEKIDRIENELKEVSKQQKYLWQTLQESNELKQQLKNLEKKHE
jgi:hypothetical protein